MRKSVNTFIFHSSLCTISHEYDRPIYSPRKLKVRHLLTSSLKSIGYESRESCGPYCSTSPGGVLYMCNLYFTEKVFSSIVRLHHNFRTTHCFLLNSFKPLSKQFLLPSLYSSHPHTVFPSVPTIPNTADTFHCFPIVVVRHPSCSIP